ncbi:MAG: Gfo/Idh/MocA family oxidoreductase, partial [Candidatus Hydrogenedentes bacterium]|nr:Gfo/Idh/MocA family oxidoreductase [Candidatus Hydrogenedentota bacterium]
MPRVIRWGILGPGRIAHKFAEALKVVKGTELQAVGSRTQANADAFGEQHGIPHRHASYEVLAQDPEVEVIYIATPHPMHHAAALLCLEAGKHVLCEKPFTINRPQAEELVRRAREQGLFLMEAMWTRFLPTLVQTRRWITAGAIGEVRLVQASFCFRAEDDEASRLLAP